MDSPAAPPAASAIPLLLLSTLLTHYKVGYFSVDDSASAPNRWILLFCKAMVFPAYTIVGDMASGDENLLLRRALLGVHFFAAATVLYVALTRAVFFEHTADSAALVHDLVLWMALVGAAVVVLA